MRLDKFISNNSAFSRNEASKIIRSGNVKVNDQIIKDTSFCVDENSDIIIVYNKIINYQKYHYIILYKPKGYICSNSNIDGISILNLIDEPSIKNLHIVGRLDKDTTGIVILTNDGGFTHNLKNPKYNIEKEYEVTLKKTFTNQMYNTLKSGIKLDGKILKPFKIHNVNDNKLNIILTEGKHHQIKRMFSAVNNEVIDLKRIRIANLLLNNFDLNEGEYLVFKKEDLIL